VFSFPKQLPNKFDELVDSENRVERGSHRRTTASPGIGGDIAVVDIFMSGFRKTC
jgi:hypothetical protein